LKPQSLSQSLSLSLPAYSIAKAEQKRTLLDLKKRVTTSY